MRWLLATILVLCPACASPRAPTVHPNARPATAAARDASTTPLPYDEICARQREIADDRVAWGTPSEARSAVAELQRICRYSHRATTAGLLLAQVALREGDAATAASLALSWTLRHPLAQERDEGIALIDRSCMDAAAARTEACTTDARPHAAPAP